jgi:hypothetical protein
MSLPMDPIPVVKGFGLKGLGGGGFAPPEPQRPKPLANKSYMRLSKGTRSMIEA